jgi:polyisoprenyl-teichoic acid--peptidoglycan teichoic acid transferase
VRTDIPRKLLPAFVDLAGKVKARPIKSVSFELSDEFDPNDPDFDYVRTAVQAALEPHRTARAATRPSAPGTTAGSSATSTAAPTEPSRLSDAGQDCAYQPAATAGQTSGQASG